MVTRYTVTTPEEKISKEGKPYMKDRAIIETYSKVHLLKRLYEIYKVGVVIG
jgi:hypothetical protein